MGGKLDIESEEEKGSTFFFTLNLNKAEQSLLREKVNMSDTHVGYMVPDMNIERAMNPNLQAYVEYVGAEFTVYEGADLLSMKKSSLPDILFINYRYCKRANELEEYLKLDTKIVVVTTGELKGKIEALEEQIDRIFYKPINLTKTLKSLEIVNEDTNKSKTPQVELNKSNEKFENIHALVAEDNSINQKLIKNVLNGLGVDVTLADNGKEAFELRQGNEYDIIFMDIQMPVMGGIEATGKILEFETNHRKHHVPIVAVTANALEGDREKYINEGMDNYLSKPIELEQIKLLIEEYVSHKIVKNEKETIENDNTKNSDNTIEVKEVEAAKEVEVKKVIEQKRRSDVLVYHSMPLIANLYGSILKNLDYDKDIVTDEEVFLDRLDDTEYTFVLYEAESFVNMPCMIVDLIKDSGAKPFALVHNLLEQDKSCCDTLEEKANIAEVREKFQIDQ